MPQLEVVIHIPLNVSTRIRSNSQPRNQRGKMARRIQERYPRQINRASQYIASALDQSASESGIDKVLLRQFPGNDLAWTADRITLRLGHLSLALPGNC